jgi:putative chitinase
MTEKLKRILFAVLDKTESTAGAQSLYLPLSKLFAENGINSDKEMAEFCAQCAHESAGFRRLIENLNYSAEGLARTWPSRYANADKSPNELAHRIARNPEQIANHTYSNRLGNGSPESGDGWKYRGRGIIQLTGKSNYQAAQDALGINCVDNPDTVGGIQCAARVAVWFWIKNKCGKAKSFEDQTKIINGGTHGIDDRRARLSRALAAISER